MDIKALVSQLTLEEKAGLCSGLDFWHTKPVDRLGIPSIMMTDGPHGLRKQVEGSDHLGLNESVLATCFPAGCATANSFDRGLLTRLGEALGDECQAEGVSMVLGPALNIKRSPLCGRNFEYLSEDPYLAGELAAAHVKGVQSKGIAACPKHFAANNQENRRFTSDSQLDERTLREIYLSAFESVVKQSKPWTMMCSYNRLNGEYTARDHRLLTEILRDEWGFDGYVVSDWGATYDRVRCLAAGMELEMPASGGINDKLIVAAVRSGELAEEVLDTACERLLEVTFRTRLDQVERPYNALDEHDELAIEIACESAVLLQNDELLPLTDEDSVCFIGEFFEAPRFQGGGSSHINAYRITSARQVLPDAPYAKGFSLMTTEPDEQLEAEALELARQHDVVVVFAGLPDAFESEGYDREHMRMPDNQLALIDALIELDKDIVVVLHNGSPVEMPWADDVNAILDMYIGGQGVGRAAVKLLYGECNPCGKLAETLPVQLSDTPCYLWYNKNGNDAPYHEGVFVGYRYYEMKDMEVMFPFGYGLSYTNFEYKNMRVAQHGFDIEVQIDITNAGDVFGKEIVQLYVAAPDTGISRPVKELKGFEKVALRPGETKTVSMKLDRRSFAYWNERTNGWFVAPGEYELIVGRSSVDDELRERVIIDSDDAEPLVVTRDTLLGELMADPRTRPVFDQMLQNSPLVQSVSGDDDMMGLGMMFQKMIQYMPLRSTSMMGMPPDQLDGLIEQLRAMING